MKYSTCFWLHLPYASLYLQNQITLSLSSDPFIIFIGNCQATGTGPGPGIGTGNGDWGRGLGIREELQYTLNGFKFCDSYHSVPFGSYPRVFAFVAFFL